MRKAKPLLIISGFLGAGKTTLLRRMLAAFEGHGIRADIILNDFADASLDTATLNTRSAATVSPLSAGCACCESLEELVSLCTAAEDGDGDLLLIELNGTADPVALHESFTLIQDRLPFFPRLQVCVVDARNWGQRGEFSPLERRQIETAGFWLPSHVEEVSPDQLQRLRNNLKQSAPYAVEATSTDLVRRLVAANSLEARTGALPSNALRPGNLSQERPSEDARSARNDPLHTLSHTFAGCQIRLPQKVRTVSINRVLQKLPNWVLRAKALVKLLEEPGCRWLFERVGSDLIPQPLPVHGITRAGSSLVCIGPQLNTQELHEIVAAEFGTSWSQDN